MILPALELLRARLRRHCCVCSDRCWWHSSAGPYYCAAHGASARVTEVYEANDGTWRVVTPGPPTVAGPEIVLAGRVVTNPNGGHATLRTDILERDREAWDQRTGRSAAR